MIDALRPIPLAGQPDRPPLVLVHGFMGQADDWRPLAEALGRYHHVFAVNLPGHGPDWTPEAVAALDFPACAAAIAAHLDALASGQVALLGYSMGGRIALYLAMHYPERVSRLILESASPGLDTEEKRAIRAAQDDALADRLESLEPGSPAFQEFVEEWYGQPLFTSLHGHREVLNALVARRVAVCEPGQLALALRTLGTGVQPDLWPELHAFRTPTLLIAGEADRKFRIIAEDMALACPAMAVEILSGCGHNVHLENTGAYTTVVRAFLHPR